MSRFPNTRMAFARIFANLSILALPTSERGCLDVGFSYADLLHQRAFTIKAKGEEWRVEDDEPAQPTPENTLLSELKVERGIYKMRGEEYTSKALHRIITEFEAKAATPTPAAREGSTE